MSEEKELTEKQERFCQEYLIDLNATQAAIRAGYSKETAAAIGYENLIKPHIQEYISKLQKQRSERTQVTADQVVTELARVGFANIQDFIYDDNTVRDLSQIDRGKAAAVSAVKKIKKLIPVKNGDPIEIETVEFKTHDKIAALINLGRHIGMFEKDNSQKALVALHPDLSKCTMDELLTILKAANTSGSTEGNSAA